ncbi:MAG: hypothetical protein ACFFFG_03160 [Candidatus Thorarchaeota archaeon]
MVNNEIFSLQEPFSFTELEKKGLSIKRSDLAQFVKKGKLMSKKIGRMTIYWNHPSVTPEATTGLDSLVNRLELENQEMKRELQSEREKVRRLEIQDGVDDPWKEAALTMAQTLAEQKGISMREVLGYFNAPLDEY